MHTKMGEQGGRGRRPLRRPRSWLETHVVIGDGDGEIEATHTVKVYCHAGNDEGSMCTKQVDHLGGYMTIG